MGPTTTTISFSSIARSRTRKMPLWVNIENVSTGPYVALSKVENGVQLCLEEEVPGKEEQLWDYEEARSSGIFRSKTGLVADMKGSVGPELICWPHHGGPNQKFEIKDDFFIHCEIDDKVWDVKGGRLTPGGPLILWPKHGGPNQQFRWRGKESR